MTSTILPRSRIYGGVAAWCGGSGPPMLLIHGVGLRAESWAAMLPYLTPHFTVTAVDMPGHGHSAAHATQPALSDYSDQIAAHLDEPTFVVGHSMGALIAMDMATRHPARMRAIAPLNAIFRRSHDAQRAVQARAAELSGDLPDPSATLARWFGADPVGTLGIARDACCDWLTTVDPAGYRHAYHVFAHADGPSDAALAQMHCPAMFMTGADEPNSTPAMSRALADVAPLGCVQIIANARHMMPMTHAKQVADLLIQFHAART